MQHKQNFPKNQKTKQKTKRGKKKKRNISLYYCNVNGVRTKYESLQNIINNQVNPDVFAICETKVNSHSKLKHFFPDYNLLTRVIKQGKGGLVIAVKKNLFPKVLDVTTSSNKNILVARAVVSNLAALRFILVYGPQENENAEDREAFMLEVSIEIQKCVDSGDIPMVMGDLNAKVGMENERLTPLSSNGKLLLEVVNLKIVNFTTKCQGKWTHVIRTTDESSVLEYVMVPNSLLQSISEMVIDEECLMCPFVQRKKGVTYSDHNAIMISMMIDIPKTAKTDPDFRWKIDEDSIQKIKELTSIEACPEKELSGYVQQDYNNLEDTINQVLSKSCKKQKRKNGRPKVGGKYIGTLMHEEFK